MYDWERKPIPLSKQLYMISFMLFIIPFSILVISLIFHVSFGLNIKGLTFEVNYVEEDFAGSYLPNSNSFWIFTKGQPYHAIINACYHETAHYIHDELLEPEEWEKYETMVSNTNFSVSHYAQFNTHEDFAETFELWVVNKYIGPERQEFFDDYVLQKTWSDIQ